MAEYLVLIYGDEGALSQNRAETMQELMEAHNRFPGEVEKLGAKVLGGHGLQGSATATSIRGGTEVTDGPFAETKEVLGGYYLVEASDLDQALEVGKLCPAPHGGVEVRPVMVFD